MRFGKFILGVAMILGIALFASAQGKSAGSAVGSRREPCWKVAGISPSSLQQRRSIEQNAKSQIAALCSDSSLSPQQRSQQIKAIHQKTQQAIQALITPQQEEALKACRAARGNTEIPHAKGSGAGPCGEMPQENPSGTSNHKFN